MEEDMGPIKQERSIKSQNSFLVKTFLWMFMGLLATGIISYITYATGTLDVLAYNGTFSFMLIAELVVVLVLSLLFNKMSPTVASIFFFVYAIINGITLSTIFYSFEISSIVLVFFAAAAIFGICAAIGYFTNKDLSKIGTIALVALLVCVVVSVINLFLGNSLIDIVIDWIVLILFTGITAWDMQKVRNYARYDDGKLHINFALELYLDFINIFIRLLSIFGSRRD